MRKKKFTSSEEWRSKVSQFPWRLILITLYLTPLKEILSSLLPLPLLLLLPLLPLSVEEESLRSFWFLKKESPPPSDLLLMIRRPRRFGEEEGEGRGGGGEGEEEENLWRMGGGGWGRGSEKFPRIPTFCHGWWFFFFFPEETRKLKIVLKPFLVDLVMEGRKQADRQKTDNTAKVVVKPLRPCSFTQRQTVLGF